MSVVSVLLSVLIVVASALCAVGIWALTEGVKTARSVRRLSDDLDVKVVPLLDKADVTIDALNAELLRVDAIVTRFEEIGDRVETTSRTVQDVANAPVEIVTDIAERVRRAWRTRRHPQPEGYGPARREPARETQNPEPPAGEPSQNADHVPTPTEARQPDA